MQNFTLRGRRIKWFFFSFLLFVGTIPSIYGQCPTVTDPVQSFCNALSTVSDLQPTGATWYADETSDEPLPSDELLMDGEDYYADSEDCTTPRSDRMVTVTLTGPTSAPNVQDDFFTPCSGAGPYTVANLKEAIDADPAPTGYTLEVFQTRYTAGETPLSDGATITEGNYYVGYTDGSGCETRRKPVRFEPVEAPAPAATSPQTVCEGTTVSELEAEGTNLWYRTETSEPALPDDYVVQNNETYWATQVVPADGPPCESEERTPVQVNVVSFDAGPDVEESICLDVIQGRLNSGETPTEVFLSLVEDRNLPSTVTFSPTIESIVENFSNDPTQIFTTLATFTTPEGCTDDVELEITVNESYNAGEDNTEGNEVCRSEFSDTVTEAEVETYLTSLLSEDADESGEFSNITSITNDINNGLTGPFSSTYTVGAGQPCEDTAELEFEIDEAEDLGMQVGDGIYCQSEIDSRLAQTTMYEELAREIFLEQLDPGVPQDGDFENMTLEEVVNAYGGGTRAFSTTYSITTENGCSSSVDISFEILDDTNAGDDNLTDNEACRSEFSTTATETEVEDYLMSLLSNDADGDGEFSNLSAIASDITNGDNGPFNSIYTTGSGTECPDTAEFQFSVIDDIPANAGSYGNETLCENDEPLDLFTLDNNDPDAMDTGMFTGEGVTDNVFDPSSVTPGASYTIRYTVSADPENCITGEEFTEFDITVDPAPISANVSRELCVTAARDLINNESEGYNYVLGILNETGVETVDPGNFESGAIAEAEAMADFIETPTSESETFNFTYNTPSENSCDDGKVNIAVTITNTEDANAGDIEGDEVCENSDPIDLNTYLEGTDATRGGTFSGNGVTGNMFDPSVVEPGPTVIQYSVDGDDGECTTPGTNDTSEFTITVIEAQELGNNIEREFCESEVNDFVSPEDVEDYYKRVLAGRYSESGTFDPSFEEISEQYNEDNTQEFITEYTVGSGDCSDSILIIVNIYDEGEANAGSFDDPAPLCTNDEPLDLTSLTNNDPDAQEGGTFTGEGVSNNTFDPAQVDGAGVYTITYSLDDSQPCITGESFTEFDITVEDSPLNINISRSLCITDAQALISNSLEGYEYISGLLDEAGIESVDPSKFDPDPAPEAQRLVNFIDSPTSDSETFNFTYLTESSTNCGDGSINVEITINNTQDAEAGTIEPQTVCVADGLVDLTDYLDGSGADSGGTFSGEGVTDNNFDPSIGVGTYTITYEVDGSGDCVTPETSDSTTFDITVTGSRELGPKITRRVCVEDFPDNEADLLDYLAGLIGSNYSSDGTFAPSVSELIEDYNEEPIQTYNTTYTLGSGDCQDSVEIEIEVFGEEPANAGGNFDFTVCSDSGMIDLSLRLADATPGGTFTGEGVTEGMFDSSLGSKDGGYEITYSVDNSAACVIDGTSDEAIITIFVEDSFTLDTESDREQVCETNVSNLFPNATAVRNFYLGMLTDDTPRNGTFEPTIQQLINRYNSGTRTGDFTTKYTVTQGECSASVDLTIEITELETIDLGEIPEPEGPVCQNEDEVDLYSFLPDGMDTSGMFEGYENGILDPNSLEPDSYNIIYTVEDSSTCTEGSASFTITVSEAANAGEPLPDPLTACKNDAEIDLYLNGISSDADTNGEFTFKESGEVIANGLVNPAELAADSYIIVYTVGSINDCGDDSVELTLTVSEAPDAPEVNSTLSFCAILDPTGADLIGENDELTFYSDAELSMMVVAEDELVAATYYVTQRNETGCESDATEVTVTISDPGVPTLDPDNDDEFCSFDDPTIADLTEKLEQTSNITWYSSEDGTEPLSTGTALQDGATYYASLYDPETDCDSAERLAVTVTINDDCDLFFPEGISPNGDTRNDTFEIEDIELKYPNYNITIHNRWGDVIYKGNANTPDWDGTANQSGTLGDDVLPVGVYFYLLDFNDGVTAPRRGKVYLSR